MVYPLVALMALIGATAVSSHVHHALSVAHEQRDMAIQMRDAAQQELDGATRQAAVVRRAKALMAHAGQAGYAPGQWSIRRVDFRQAAMTRETVNELLSQIHRNSSQMFGADEFELSMKSATGSLFEAPLPEGGDASLLFTLSGTLYFRLGAS
ncbi:hypothetical protein WT83_04855 [Burkholderia territorii]|uniref:Uncharacterized protein n=1 Tax=Burkholderia territorii TaxID=1503055 RepID=A0A119VNZ2_9BURK|nr:hypothetical protein [Burkholderia territorii]KWN22004.1 hypothetical protein WT83_04855 [Burkholderia territorii]